MSKKIIKIERKLLHKCNNLPTRDLNFFLYTDAPRKGVSTIKFLLPFLIHYVQALENVFMDIF